MALPTFSKPVDAAATSVYTVPAGKNAAVTVNVAALLACKVKIAITAGAVPTDANWIETLVALPIGGVLIREPIVLPADHKIYVQTDTANSVAVQVYGIEEPA